VAGAGGHRGRALGATSILAACLLALAICPVAAPARTSKAIRRAEARIRACANRERRAHGVPPVRASRILNKAARLHASNMARYAFFDHVDPWGRSPGDRIHLYSSRRWSWGENISAGYTSVRAVCRGWMHSAGHRHNILDPRFKRVGGGFARSGRGPYRTYFVMDLGTPLGP
jgi:uncharacterized protein YkwD